MGANDLCENDDCYEVFLCDDAGVWTGKTFTVCPGERFSIPMEYAQGEVRLEFPGACYDLFVHRLRKGPSYAIFNYEVVEYEGDKVQFTEYFPIEEVENRCSMFVCFSVEKYFENGDALQFDTTGPKWGYVDPYGDIVVPAIYEDSTFLNQNQIGAVMQNGRWYMIDIRGQRIDELYYDDVVGPFLNTGYFSFAKKEWGTGRGVIDSAGHVFLKPFFDTMPLPISDKLFLACLNGRNGVINHHGIVLLPFGACDISIPII